MQTSSSQNFTIRDIDFDPATLTSFGAPPPCSDGSGEAGGSKLGAFFGAFASAFRRTDDISNQQKNAEKVIVSQPRNVDHAENRGSISGNSDTSTVPPLDFNDSPKPLGPPGKKFANLFRRNPPVSVGLNAKWASDDACHHCYSCSLKFSTFLRRHHCRFCGRIFCDACSSFRIPGRPFGAREGLRSCEVCYRETLRSLLETHHESLSDDMLEKIASLYAAVAGSFPGQSYQSQSSAVAVATPVIQNASSSTNNNRNRIVASPRATMERQVSVLAANIVPPSPVSVVNITDDSSVILDPLRRPMNRRMTMDEDANNSGCSGDEYDGNQRYRKEDAMSQLSNLRVMFESAFLPNAGLKFETRRSLAKTYYHCFSGDNLLKWLIARDRELNNLQAAAIAKSMLDVGVIVPLHRTADREAFSLATYYRPGKAAGFMPITDKNVAEKSAVVQASRLSVSKTNAAAVTVTTNPNRRSTTSSTAPRSTSFGVATVGTATKTNQMNVQVDAAVGESLQKNFMIKERPSEVLPYRASDVEVCLRRLYKIHLARMCSHLLAVEELDPDKWQRNILQIVSQVVRIVKPRPRDYQDALDIRRCVKIKKIYDSSLSAHFEYVDGLVFTKSLSHRQMRSSLYNPRFLLLQTGLDFERDCQQLTTLDVVVHQEAEQMQRYVSQIASVKPTVLFCGGSIPHLACQQLLANDITAASFVKPHILEQVARYTGAAILSSVDSLSLSGAGQSPVRLGQCRTFASFSVHLHSRLQKTFLCLSGCDPIGCTLLIRDSSYSDLIKVKRILKLLILAAYDGLVLSQHLAAVRADPYSFDLKPPYNTVNDKLTSRLMPGGSAFDEDESGGSSVIISANRRSLSVTRNSSASRAAKAAKNVLSGQLWKNGSNDLAALDLSSLSQKATHSTLQNACNLAASGLLSLSPLIRLPDPMKKSALFEASQSRIYFESPLFLLLAASYIQGKRPMQIENPAPPMCVSKSVQRVYDKFFTTPLTGDYQSMQVQTLLAEFRRRGFMYEIMDDTPAAVIHKKSSVESNRNSVDSTSKCGAWVKPLSIFECQCLHVLTSTFSLDSQLSPFRHCDGPRLVSCPFHARSDLSLGAFLENQCFVPTTICPRRGCGAPLVDHVRRFASNSGRIEIVVRPLAEPILSILSLADPRPSDVSSNDSISSNSTSLISWSMCRSCRSVTPFVEVNDDVWGMSLASYLHLKFYGVDFLCVPATVDSTKCTHPFGKNYLQFFAKESLVAVVRYSPINVYDLVIPSATVVLDLKSSQEVKERHDTLLRDHETLASAILNHFDTVQAYLETCRTHLLYAPNGALNVSQPAVDIMATSESYLADERKLFITNMAALELAITDPAWQGPVNSTIIRTTEQIIYELFQSINQSWLDWNDRLRNLIKILRTHSSASNATANMDQVEIPGSLPTAIATASIPIAAPPSSTSLALAGSSEAGGYSNRDSFAGGEPLSAIKDDATSLSRPTSFATLPVPVSVPNNNKPLGKTVLDFLADTDMFKQPLFRTKLKLPLKLPFEASSHYIFRNQTYLFPVAVYDNEPSSFIAFALSTDEYNQRLHFLSSIAEREIEKISSPPTVSRVTLAPTMVAKTAIEINEANDVVDGSAVDHVNSTTLTSTEVGDEDDDDPDEDAEEAEASSLDNGSSDMLGSVGNQEDEEDDASTIEFGSTLDPVDTIKFSGGRPKIASRRPLLDSARFVAPRSQSGSRTPSAHSSPNVPRKQKQIPPSVSVPTSMNVQAITNANNTPSPRYLTPQPTAVKLDSPDARGKDAQELDPHIRITWTDASVNKEGATKFSVIIYHAAIFAEIRKLLVDKSEKEESDLRGWLETSFLRSLSRCSSWQAAGGKSGLRFFKTLDGRLILKQISKEELKTIFKLAPNYAAIIGTAREQNRPCALVPILGAFQISFENGTTGRSSKFDLIVMTNLFRSYSISDKFDLKGSERNRFVKQQQQPLDPAAQQPLSPGDTQERQPYEMVLMDENLLIRSLQDPLYVHPHSKQLLLQAIAADTQFLVRNSVMDYSLLVGIDSEARCIVVGIIDYLRTFTFDKKLEYVVKSTGLLGGQGKAPTILYPNKYRDRFLSAMRHFFLEVPDHWLAYETHNLRLASQT